ncbi:PAS domain-containing sensor histidine kinase [Halioxenophilus aromaticivorans]
MSLEYARVLPNLSGMAIHTASAFIMLSGVLLLLCRVELGSAKGLPPAWYSMVTAGVVGALLVAAELESVALNGSGGGLLWQTVAIVIAVLSVAIAVYLLLVSHNTRQALSESERRYDLAVSAYGGGVWELESNEADDMYWSQRFYHMLGVAPDAEPASFSRLLARVHPEDKPGLVENVAQLRANGHAAEVRVRIAVGSGSDYRWFTMNATSQRDQHGKMRVVGSLLDIDREMRLQTERARLLSIIDHPLLYIFQFDAEQKIIYSNRTFEHQGIFTDTYSKEEWLSPGSSDFGASQFAIALRDGSWSGDFKVNGKREIPLRAVLMVHRDNKDAVSHYSLVCRDITETLVQEAKLEDALNQLSRVTEGSSDGFWSMNLADESSFQCSEQTLALLGYTSEDFDFSCEHLEKLVHIEDYDAARAALLAAVERGQDIDLEVRLLHASNEFRWYRIRGRSYTVGVDNRHELAGSISDINPLKRLQEELQRSNLELEQFAFQASHDLKEPLRTMRTFAEHLQSDLATGDDELVKEDLNFIESAGERMSVMIDDLLRLARVGAAEIDETEIDLNELINDAVARLKTLVEDEGARVTVADTLGRIKGDSTRLGLAVQNILQNAIKFKSPERQAQLTITSTDLGDSIALGISDNGIGIAEKHQAEVFKPFKTLHSQESYGGSGIGLAVVAKVIEKHGGSIELVSQLNEGTTVTLVIPKER